MATLNVADLNRQGKVFTAANVSEKSVIAVTTAMTGLILWNPSGSGRKLIIVDAGFAWTTVPVARQNIGIAVMTANNAVPTSLTAAGSPASSADGAGNVGVGVAWDAATLPAAPVARRWLGGAAWISGASVGPYFFVDRIDGSLILVPGSAAAFTVVTTTALGMASLTWAEVPA